MKNITFKLFTLLILAALLLMPTGSAYAQGPNPGDSGRVIFGDNFTLEKGDTFNGDLVVFGGNVVIEDDASLNGNLVVIGGTIKSNGETKGDVVVVGGQISLEKSALVTGDVVTIGSQLTRAEGAKIEGEVVNNVAPNITFPSGRIPPTAPSVPSVPNVPSPNIHIDYNPFTQVFWIMFWAVFISGFAMLLALFWQPQLERAGKVMVSQPLMTGAIGLLSFFVAAILFLTIIPPVIAFLAWLFGVVAMGSEIGERFTKSLNQTWSPVLTIGFGTFLLMLVGGAIGLIPCLGGLILFLLGMVGIGGAVTTWFGLRLPQVPAMTAYTPPTPPSGSGQVPPAS
ncbi:MAG TPA: polymer-forming cytoskeletal protein [Anaerolineales bacterium]